MHLHRLHRQDHFMYSWTGAIVVAGKEIRRFESGDTTNPRKEALLVGSCNTSLKFRVIVWSKKLVFAKLLIL